MRFGTQSAHPILAMLAALLLALAGCSGEEADTSDASTSSTASPFALKGAAVTTRSGEIVGTVTGLVLNDNQETFAVITPADGGDRRVVATAALRLDDGTADLQDGRGPRDLKTYDPDRFRPMGQRVKP